MQRRKSTRAWLLVAMLSCLTLTSFFWVGCSNDSQNVLGPDTQSTNNGVVIAGRANPMIRAAMDVQTRNTPMLMSKSQVVGTATGLDDRGTPIIYVYTETAVADGVFPVRIDGLKVVQQVTGKIVAMKGKPGGPGGGVDHKAKQTPPVKMGTSGGWTHDLANGYCCGGTLGALIQVGGQKRILSNYHVFEMDIVNGGNGLTAQTGQDIIQPGLIDVNCDNGNSQVVGSLVVSSALPGSNVDCSSAVINGMVDDSGAILAIGTISGGSGVAASINQNVKKSGRTTGLTRSRVTGLNATISVQYEDECAGSPAFVKTFMGQIVIRNKGSKFLAGGDSGSLMVEDVDTNPNAVGLLYAGSSSTAIANPIGDVLDFYNGATMVGN